MRFAETYSKQEMSRNWNVVSDSHCNMAYCSLLGEPIPKLLKTEETV